MKNSQGLTTLAISLLLSGVVGMPTTAQSAESREAESSQGQLKQFEELPVNEQPEPSQPPSETMETEDMETEGMGMDENMDMSSQAMPAEVVGIVGDTVTVEMEDGTIETIEGVAGSQAEVLTPGTTVYVLDGVLYADEMAQTPIVTPEVDALTEETAPGTTVQGETEPLTEDTTEYETETYPGQTVQDTTPIDEGTEYETDDTDFETETQEAEPVRGLW